MPTVKRTSHGYTILSRYRRRVVTHQLSADGEEWLSDRYGLNGQIEGLEIDVPTLMELRDMGFAYIRGGKPWPKKTFRPDRRPALFDPPRAPPTPPPVVPPPAPPTPTPTIRCPGCGLLVHPTVLFCGRCGYSLKGALRAVPPLQKPRFSGSEVATWIVIAVLFVLFALVAMRG